MNKEPLLVDPARRKLPEQKGTGIFVRAMDGERWVSADIDELSKESLLQWLRSTGHANPLAENTVGVLLGHGHLTEDV